MIRNYIVIAWRNFVKNSTFSFINILGFALAMASCFLIIFHIQSELSYEKIYPDHKNIYRFHVLEWAKSSPAMAQAVQDFFPEVKAVTRFYEFGGGSILSYNEYQTIIGRSLLADSSAIDMFNYEFIEGDPKGSLRAPFTTILTESLAKRVFGNTRDAIGKTIVLNGDTELAVTGVIKDVPENTHIQFEMLTSFSSFYKIVPGNWTSNKGWMAPYTYLELEPGKTASFENRIRDFQVKFYEGLDTPEKLRAEKQLGLTPIDDIHLYSHMEQEMSANSNASYLYIFAGVAMFILFIASVNFINLNISLAFRRIKETGLRKVMGAVRSQLIKQHLAETLITSFVGLLIALGLFFAVIPNYNALAGRDVSPGDVITFENILVMAALTIGISLLSGAYPAFFMSRFKPTDALKSQRGPESSTPFVRKSLVVFQFAVSAFMIASTVIIIRQMNFFRNQDLGFNKDQVIAVSLYGDLARKITETPDAVKNELKKDHSVMSVARISNLPGDMISVEGVVPENADPNAGFPHFRVMRVDEEMIDALQIPIVEGRGFSIAYNDSASFIVNKAALKALNITNPIGTRIKNSASGITGPIVGVVEDYHFSSLHNAVEPLALQYYPEGGGHLLIKLNTKDVPATIAKIESTLKSIAPSNIFTYSFFEDRWNSQYKEEAKMNILFNTFSLFMIVISCVGLFGLSAVMLQTRRKEIGIRKIVGASTGTIVQIMSKEFVVLVLIGVTVGLPLSWYAMNIWLSKFAYKIDITADIFVMSVVACVAIAFTSILFNALRAAHTNPIESLRTE
jgi:putative ABC transport system permease protein